VTLSGALLAERSSEYHHPMSTPTPTPAAGWYPDPASGRMRYWDGAIWTEHFQPLTSPPLPAPMLAPKPITNTPAAFALACGIVGFLVTGIPLVGIFIGGPIDIVAIICGIWGLNRTISIGRTGTAPAIIGIVLAGISLLSIPFGAGTIW